MPSSDSKPKFAAIRDRILSQSGKDYWRSLEEYADTPEFREFVSQEYPHEIETWDNSLSRRNFMKVMGASMALAGMTGCVIQPPEKIVPYVKAPEGMLPGRPRYFATAMTLGGVATGLLAKSYDGRPIKVEGNPDHPGSQGATDVLAQASILGMYDPDRLQEFSYRGSPKTWEAFSGEVRAALEQNRADGGAGVRFLTETTTSPTLVDQFARLRAELPNSKWVQYEPINADNVTAGAKLAFGSAAQPVYHFNKATRILSLDADIFQNFNVGYIKDYSAAKLYSTDKRDLNRLYVVETSMTITGAKADHRIGVKPSQLSAVARAIAGAIGVAGAASSYTDNAPWIASLAKDLLSSKGSSVVVAGNDAPPVVHALAHAMNAALGNVGQTVTYIDPLAPGTDTLQIDQLRGLIQDIDAGRVKMLIILGGNPVYTSPADLKLTVDRMSRIPFRAHVGLYLDETGEICHWNIPEKHYLESWSDTRAYDGTTTIVQPLIQPLYDGKNYHEVVQLFFKDNFDKRDYDIVREYWQKQNISPSKAMATPAPGSAPVNSTANAPVNNTANGSSQTATHSTSAGSGSQTSKTAPPTKPTDASTPANGSAAPTSTSAPGAQQGAPSTSAPAVATSASAAKFEDAWRRVVHDGFIPGTAAAPKTLTANTAFLASLQVSPQASGLEISIRPDPSIYDGRFANNGWLQELPKPLNKVTWDNVALVSPKTAERLGINQSDRRNEENSGGYQGITFLNTKGGNLFSDQVTLTYQGASISTPVPMWIQPGVPDDTITLFLGFGRSRAGRVGTGVGYNAYEVRRSDALASGFGDIKKLGTSATIASTQTHFNMEGRDILRVWNLDEFEKNPKMGHQPDEYPETMYVPEQHEAVYEKNSKWGMTIDLNSCVGCNACVIACQSENNIAVVGKEQVERHRMMHWLRVDAYFGGDDINDPEGPHFQPVLCQQCEQAPCEVVCPVHATVHSAEGLNDMTYNRCVGTRYCSNNCPYKVRRFNFLLFQDWDTPQYKLMRNPEVTIRSRGVMEKCTYCTQRIAAARIEAQKDGARPIRDGEVQTACQTVCPTNAIIFGDMHDQSSAVAKTKKDQRNYIVLNNLNTQPRTTYLAEMKNQNRDMPDYKSRLSTGVEEEETKEDS